MIRQIWINEPGTYSIPVLLALDSAGGSLQIDTTNFACNTAGGGITLVLPEGIGLTNINVKWFITDISGNAATNPIIIQTAGTNDKINGLSSVSVNTNNGSAWITGAGALQANVGSTFAWICTYGGAANSIANGSGSGIQLSEFDVTFTAVQLAAMLANSVGGALQILPALTGGKVYDIVTFNAYPSGTALSVAEGQPTVNAGTDVGGFPLLVSGEGWITGTNAAGFVPCAFGNFGDIVRQLDQNASFVLFSDANYTVTGGTGGKGSLRIYGLYRVKQL